MFCKHLNRKEFLILIMKKVLAFDFGASSGRAVMGTLDNGKITLEEVHRFDNDPVMVHGCFHWDCLRLLHEIKQGIIKAGNGYESIGIDTWGVDYGLFASDGRLIGNPYCYRDVRTQGLSKKSEAVMPADELYRRSGIQILDINTIFQLMALKEEQPYLLDITDKILFVPDMFNYFLTGKMYAERSFASTTQLYEPYKREWNTELMDKFGIPQRIFAPLIDSGTVIGDLTGELCEELNVQPKKVIAVASHDTASAVAAVPAQDKDFVYISCGTWSLFGTELDEPVITEASQKYNITNEAGHNRTIRFLKNIIGLWLIQETRRRYKKEGKSYSYGDMEQLARDAAPFSCFIDPDSPEFGIPGNMPERIREFCKKTGQYVPKTDGEVIRCIYESLAMKYKHTFAQLEECTNKKFPVIHMVGGGTKDPFLCQMTADASGVNVVAGPVEGTAAGNIAVQLMALGEIADIKQARSIIKNSFETKTYAPADNAAWCEAYERFVKILV